MRNHGYLIYDTLFAIDGKFEPQPQMVESWTVSDDKLIWTFKLRDGLKWHDGTPVTSADVHPLDQALDGQGRAGRPARQVDPGNEGGRRPHLPDRAQGAVRHDAEGARQSASVPLFVMPKRVAETLVPQQISDTTGSGPFIFKKTSGRRAKRSSMSAIPTTSHAPSRRRAWPGGKVAKLDRIEWRSIPYPQTAVNALMQGEVDMIEFTGARPPALEKTRTSDRRPRSVGPAPTCCATTGSSRRSMTSLSPRRDASLNQKGFLQAVIGDPRYYKECKAMFGCGTPLETSAGMQGLLELRFEELRKLLKELGYDGTPIVVLQTSDNPTLTNLAPVTKTLLERGGFKVDVQSMDWQTLVARRAKKDPVAQGGWNIAQTAAAAVLLLDPSTTTTPRRAAIARSSAGRSTRRSRSSGCSSSARAIPRSSSRSPRRSRRAS